jgi:uncharacterized Zn finger protein
LRLLGYCRCPACKRRDAVEEDVSARRTLDAPFKFELVYRCKYCGETVRRETRTIKPWRGGDVG